MDGARVCSRTLTQIVMVCTSELCRVHLPRHATCIKSAAAAYSHCRADRLACSQLLQGRQAHLLTATAGQTGSPAHSRCRADRLTCSQPLQGRQAVQHVLPGKSASHRALFTQSP